MGRPKIAVPAGSVYGYLTVIEEVSPGGIRDRRFQCRCVCGKEYPVYMTNLRSGDTTSCGCKLYERTAKRMTTHGGSRSITYTSWACMHDRCNPENAHLYPTYANRKVCERWNDYLNFVADMGERPSLDVELDRKDNDFGYFPGNCRWVTEKVNSRNTRSNLKVSMLFKTQALSAWAEELKLPYHSLYRRVKKGMSLRDAVTELRAQAG